MVFSPDNDNAITLSAPDASRSDIYAEELSAPNLFRFAHRDWLTGLLDPEQIGGPNYFGNTKLKKMANFVGDSLIDLVEEERQDIRKIVKVLSAEARLRSQTDQDAKDAEQIAEGRNPLIKDYGCPDCHKFQDEGALGDAPDLTGYGSRRWLMDIIANPAQKRFYGTTNDRMPAYAESSDEPTKNLLSDRDIALLTDWLRGEWYEPQ